MTSATSRRRTLDGEAEDDYDMMRDDTDTELTLMSLQRGLLLHKRSACSRGHRRWCVLDTAGALYIVGQSYNCMFDFAKSSKQGVAKNFQQVCPGRWRLKSVISRRWETLSADRGEAEKWADAFDLALRLSTALRDPRTKFAALLWKEAQKEAKAEGRRASTQLQWKRRLFLLHKDGRFFYYSHRESRFKLIGVLGDRGEGEIAPCDVTWTTLNGSLVPYKVRDGNGQVTIFAGPAEDCDALFRQIDEMRSFPSRPA